MSHCTIDTPVVVTPRPAVTPAAAPVPEVAPNEREAEAVCEAVWPLQDACEALLEKHAAAQGADRCECGVCDEIRWLLKTLGIAESFIAGGLLGWPAHYRRRALKWGTELGNEATARTYEALAQSAEQREGGRR
jgi:hypothetical protein